MENEGRMQTGTRLIAGGILVAAAGLLALGRTTLLSVVEFQHSWPVILIVVALAQLAVTIRDPRQQGWGLLLLGDWLFVNTMTDWAYPQLSWPLLLAGVGAWVIASGARRTRISQRDRNVA
jgi:hypothetical protein